MVDTSSFSLQDALINLFSDYVPLPCWMTLRSRPEYSFGLGPVPRRTHPIYFEVEFGLLAQRTEHNRRQFRRREQGPFAASHAGLADIFVPLAPKPGRPAEAWITLGAFQSSLPSPAELWKRWCGLRRSPGPDDAEAWLLYASSIYDTPVLDDAAVRRLGRMLTAVGRALLGYGTTADALKAVDEAKRRSFGPSLPWRMWHYAEARRDRYHRGPFQGAELAPWDAEEFRLKRGPDTALALVPMAASGDAAEALYQAAQLQWACFEHCRQHPGLVAGRLGDEGALILAAASRLQARDLALAAAQVLSRRLGWRVACSWQSRPGQREALDQTIHAAENALRGALARGQDLSEAAPGEPEASMGWSSADLGTRLADLASEGHFEAARLLRADLVEQVVRASGGRVEALRVHLLWALTPLLESAGRRLGPGARDELRPLAALALGQPLNTGELLRRFTAECESLFERLHHPAQGGLALRLRRAAVRLQQHPEERTDLKSLAREAGLSPFHFSRQFKRLSGLGIAQARLQARLAKARRLLKESSLPIEAVAAECGFKNAAHFSTAFKKDQGLGPRAWRERQPGRDSAKKEN